MTERIRPKGPDLEEAIKRARGGGTHAYPKHITSGPLILLTRWADTAYKANGVRLYTDHEIAAAKDAIARLDRVLGEARAILKLHRINERDQGHWGDLWCAVAAANAEPIKKAGGTP